MQQNSVISNRANGISSSLINSSQDRISSMVVLDLPHSREDKTIASTLFTDHLATMQATANLYKQLSRHVLTRKHLTVLFFELSLNVGLRNGTITKEHVNLLTNALNIHCSRQIFTELVVITKWLNSKLKDW
jgi:hypothetical protein